MSIRGLPDERPRPSVANLIGKFEQRASKRQSSVGPGGLAASPTSSPVPSRSTSTVSNNTVEGDAALVAAKERREWPPKNVTNETLTNVSTFNVADLRRSLEKNAATDSTRSVVASPPPDAPNDGQASLSASVENVAVKQEPSGPPRNLDAQSDPNPTPSTAVEESKSVPIKKDTQTTTRAPGKLTTSKSTNSVRSPRTKGTITTAGATPRHSIAQSKSATATPGTKPLTAQSTGNLTAGSGAGGVSTAARAGAKSPPVLRAKTPTALRASTSTSSIKANRAKTPTASLAVARSKTPTPKMPSTTTSPGSGLYAPTKASLARARNAEAPPPPMHEKKVPSSVLERLMKPTAASASKVRETPVSPPRAPVALAKTASGRGAAPAVRGKTVKPRVGLAPARMNAEREKKEAAAKAAGVAVTGAGAVSVAGAVATDALAPEPITSEDEVLELEQPSFASTTAAEEHEHGYEHEDEHEEEHGPPSDIESYDDAFASDDDRGIPLDSAHLVSARPSEEGDREVLGLTPEPELQIPGPEVQEIVTANIEQHEHEDAAEATRPTHVEEEEVHVHTPEDSVVHTESTEVELEVPPAATANGATTPTPTAAEHKQNGVSPVPAVPDTEFDSVLDMLSVKPPARTVSPAGEIPDDE